MEAVASGVDRWANRNECAKVGVFAFCGELSSEKWKKAPYKDGCASAFCFAEQNETYGQCNQSALQTAVASQCADAYKFATLHQPATAVGGAKGCQFIEGEACKGNKFAHALTEGPRQHPAPQPPNRVRAKGAQRVRKYDRCRKLSTSTIKSQTRSMQFPFCTGQRLKAKHNLPHLYKPEEKQALAFLYELKSQKRSSSFRYPPRLGGKSKKGARPLFGRWGEGFQRERRIETPLPLACLWLLSARAESDPGSGAGQAPGAQACSGLHPPAA